jgi:hypothetical protein
MFRPRLLATLIASAFAAFAAPAAQAAVELIAIGSLTQATDLSGLTGTVENGAAANMLGGIGSGLAWAGGTTFLATPDRGPNAIAWNAAVDDTTSYISRFQTINLQLTAAPSGGLPYTLTPTLQATTLLSTTSALNYGPVSTVSGGLNYFNGRSDNFGAGNSLNTNNARLDPEGIRVSPDGKSVFVADEYGPYLYQFDRTTGQRIKAFELPANLAISNLSAMGSSEISGNTVGRIANKGMEGLAITPDGSRLFGFMQSPLEQDSLPGAGNAGKGRVNRVVTIDISSGATHEYAYDNQVGTKTYNSSEMLALNDHQFLVLERDGSGLGNGDATAFKQIRLVDLAGATDVTNLSGQAALLPFAAMTSLFLDLRAILNAHGIADTQIPAKLEGMAFGEDIVDGGTTYHTLYVANDNDFVPGVAGANTFFVFRFSDADLAANVSFQNQMFAVPEPASVGLMLCGLLLVGGAARRSRRG